MCLLPPRHGAWASCQRIRSELDCPRWSWRPQEPTQTQTPRIPASRLPTGGRLSSRGKDFRSSGRPEAGPPCPLARSPPPYPGLRQGSGALQPTRPPMTWKTTSLATVQTTRTMTRSLRKPPCPPRLLPLPVLQLIPCRGSLEAGRGGLLPLLQLRLLLQGMAAVARLAGSRRAAVVQRRSHERRIPHWAYWQGMAAVKTPATVTTESFAPSQESPGPWLGARHAPRRAARGPGNDL
mmetsp:Transcript_12101/g.34011  ORF Transcript_12101/g.34011 Transcript_12101/m.34011 type:complete len:237 (-) Transcript_12101:237-947(-)